MFSSTRFVLWFNVERSGFELPPTQLQVDWNAKENGISGNIFFWLLFFLPQISFKKQNSNIILIVIEN